MVMLNRHIPISGRDIEEVLEYHGLPFNAFEGKTVYDLGCGASDIGADLAIRGIEATVIGFDSSPRAFTYSERGESSIRPVVAKLDALPVKDNSADIVLATYSVPMWAASATEIDDFFDECKRVLRLGGLLSIYPIAVTIQHEDSLAGEAERASRVLAAKIGASSIERSSDWLAMRGDPEAITARKIQ